MFRSHHSRVLTLAAGAAFLALLDVTVVDLAIPALGRAYPSTSVTTLSWVITAYATTFAALLAPAGRLADVIGRRTCTGSAWVGSPRCRSSAPWRPTCRCCSRPARCRGRSRRR